MNTLKFNLVGTRPLLMHNGQLANPRNKWAKELKAVTGRRKKTESDLEEVRKIEWYGGLYLDEKNRVAIPEDVILGVVISGAKKLKLGEAAKAAVLGERPSYQLKYDGPKSLEALYADDRFCDYRGVGLNGKTVMRARPRFDSWSLEIALTVDETIMDEHNVTSALEHAGRLVGMGDFTPRFGRFDVEKMK